MIQPDAIRSIVIVGGGTAGWMAAAALSRLTANGVTRITLVESDAIGTVGVGEATIPPIRTFNAMLGIDEREFLKATRGSYKLAIEFVDWTRHGHTYLHPFGPFGADLEGVKFYQIWLKMQREGRASGFGDYNLCDVAARLNRFGAVTPQMRSPVTNPVWAYHFDASRYARFLRAYAEQRGVVRQEGKVLSVEQRPEDGFIDAIVLEDGRRIDGDLFIDCTGFRGLLIEQTLNAGFEDWNHWLPCDRAVAVQCLNDNAISPFTRSTAREAGWQWRIPLQHRVGTGYVYSSAHISDDRAAETLMSNLDGKATTDPWSLRFRAGRRKKAWIKNCVALGLASGFLEPLESTSIHMIQAGITKLLALFPHRGFDPAAIEEYNRLTNVQIEQIRDFIILHYHANERTGQDLWDHVRTMEIPDSLRRKLELFRGAGAFFRHEDELFAESSWLAVLIGQNVMPERYDPLVDALPEDGVARAMDELRRAVRAAADAMPDHAEFLARHCAAPEPEPA
ncbi:tryptophan halogenase family protein [Brevundimonas sp.]|uniref:tryptophan halogenase family protein n=1 Tax=Brevundimonas sp. TaxID=1871086 RepID=UPI00391CE14B